VLWSSRRGGTFIANGGRYEAHFNQCVLLEAGAACLIRDGIFTGRGGANVFELEKGSDISVLAGVFQTRKHDYIRLSDTEDGLGFDINDRKEGWYGTIGIPASAFPDTAVVKQNNETVYNPKASGDTTVTPGNYATGRVVLDGADTIDYKIETAETITFEGIQTYFPENCLLLNPEDTGTLAGLDESYRRNGIAGYLWQVYETSDGAYSQPGEPLLGDGYFTADPEVNLKKLYSGWEDGKSYCVSAKAIEYWSGATYHYMLSLEAAEQLTVHAYYSVDTISRVSLTMNHSGLKPGTKLQDYTITTNSRGIKTAAVLDWYNDSDEALPLNTVIEPNTRYYVKLLISTDVGYSFDYDSLVGLNGDYSRADPESITNYSNDSSRMFWSSEYLTSSIPVEVYAEGQLLTAENPVLRCSGGGSVTLDPYSNTLILDNAVIHGGDVSHIHAAYASEGILIRQADEYEDYSCESTLVTLLLKGASTIDVDSVTVTLSDGRQMQYGEGLESAFPLRIVKGDAGASLTFTGSAQDSLYVHNRYDNPYSTKDDEDYIALYLDAPMYDWSDCGSSLDDAGSLSVGPEGSYRGRPVMAWGLKLEEGFSYYGTYDDSLPLQERKAEFKHSAGEYSSGDGYTYMEIGRDYGVTVQVPGSYPIHVSSAGAGDVLHDGGSVSFVQEGDRAVLPLTDARLQGGSEPAIHFEEQQNAVIRLQGRSVITMQGSQSANDCTAVDNDGAELLISGKGSLTIEAGTAGGVYGYGILCGSLDLNFSGSLVIRDCMRGIAATGLQELSGGQAYTRYLDYCNGMVTIYSPGLSGYSCYAVSHAPRMTGGSWAGEWRCYVGSENNADKARAYSGDDIQNYPYLKLWRSNTGLTGIRLQIRGGFDDTFTSQLRPKAELQLTGRWRVEKSAVTTAGGDEVTQLTSGQTYIYDVTYISEKTIDPESKVTLIDSFAGGGETESYIPLLPAGSESQGSCLLLEGNTLRLKYYFTAANYQVSGQWLYKEAGQSSYTAHPLYSSGELSITGSSRSMTLQGDCGENGLVFDLNDLKSGDSLTFAVPGYAAREAEKTYGGENTVAFYFYLLGDSCCDGKLDLKDVSEIFRRARTANPDTQSEAGRQKTLTSDVDGDGNVSLRDVSELFRSLCRV